MRQGKVNEGLPVRVLQGELRGGSNAIALGTPRICEIEKDAVEVKPLEHVAHVRHIDFNIRLNAGSIGDGSAVAGVEHLPR